ncbi:MAG TPA: hydrolase [Labilithrix sp.]|nr:hydrolase [Labilithrix sp.]
MAPEPTATASNPASVIPTGCCPPFDPATFQDKEITWAGKTFVKERVHSIFHVPLDMGRKLTNAMRLIDSAHATTAQRLILSDEISPWRSDLYIDANGPVPGADMITLSGTFLTRVYEGPFRDAPKWCEDMAAKVAAKGRTLKKMYLGYTTCPACAKAYGKNYVIAFAQVAPRVTG